MIDAPAPRSRPTTAVTRPALATLACWYAAAILAVAVVVSTLPDHNTDGTCEGIGFGCALNPRDTALLLAIAYGIPLLVGSVLASLVTLALAVAARIRSGVAAGTLAAFAGPSIVVGIVAVATAW